MDHTHIFQNYRPKSKRIKQATTYQEVLAEKEDYQYKLIEIPCSYSGLEAFPAPEPDDEDNEQTDYYEAFIPYLNRFIQQLTRHQRSVIKGILSGKTQYEIAKQLGCNQSAISKCLIGNMDYSANKSYGGIFRKLTKFFQSDPDIYYLAKAIFKKGLPECFNDIAPPIVPLRNCTRCKNDFPLTMFYIHKGDAYRAECKACMLYQQRQRVNNRESKYVINNIWETKKGFMTKMYINHTYTLLGPFNSFDEAAAAKQQFKVSNRSNIK